ncbi:hypothetical protein P154DRAFT_280863 [Amniculicola lignicola CBS 123094]|uniref:Uncharacterized protein n=1 Tax=Amniculicola lignicola CBS 123094 TaxID=1392246 RepID=A0A6A5W6R1_9PLEO|nr:hypothetical protein P154DRAFT_280863 [Amniculicola lignicola CBS 123094]
MVHCGDIKVCPTKSHDEPGPERLRESRARLLGILEATSILQSTADVAFHNITVFLLWGRCLHVIRYEPLLALQTRQILPQPCLDVLPFVTTRGLAAVFRRTATARKCRIWSVAKASSCIISSAATGVAQQRWLEQVEVCLTWTAVEEYDDSFENFP